MQKLIHRTGLVAALLIVQCAHSQLEASGYRRMYSSQDVEGLAAHLVSTEHMEDAQKILIPACRKPSATGTMHALLAKTYMDDPYETAKLAATIKSELQKAIALDPNSGVVYRVWAEFYNLQGDYKTAIVYAHKALDAKKPDKDLALRQLIVAHSNLKEYDAAVKYCDERAKYSGKTDSYYRYKATLLENTNRLPEAIQMWREAIKMRNDDNTVQQLVDCLDRAGKRQEAIVELTGLIKKNPSDDEAYAKRAKLHVKLKQYKEALDDYSTAIKEEPSSRLYKARADLYELMGRKKEAAEDLIKAKGEDSKKLF